MCFGSSKGNRYVGAGVPDTGVSHFLSTTGQVRHLVLFFFIFSREIGFDSGSVYDCSLASRPPLCSVAGLDLSTDNRVLKETSHFAQPGSSFGRNRLARFELCRKTSTN